MIFALMFLADALVGIGFALHASKAGWGYLRLGATSFAACLAFNALLIAVAG